MSMPLLCVSKTKIEVNAVYEDMQGNFIGLCFR